MSKYIDAERLNMEWETLKPFGVTDTMIENLKWIVDRQPTIEVSEDNQVLYGTDHNCILTMFGECSYNETGCSDCAVAEKIRKALSVEVSEDCISRADAVKALMAHFIPQIYTGEDVEQALKLAREIMTNAPSVVPKANNDEWVEEFSDDGWRWVKDEL